MNAPEERSCFQWLRYVAFYQPALTMRLHHFVAGREASRARARNFLFSYFFSSEQQLRGSHRGMPRSLRAALGATHASHHPTAAIINPAELHGQCVNYSRSALARVRKCAVPYTSLARVCVHARVIHRMRAESITSSDRIENIFSPRRVASRRTFSRCFSEFLFSLSYDTNHTRRKVPHTLKISKGFHDNLPFYLFFFIYLIVPQIYPKTINIDNISPRRERRGASTYLKNFVRVNGSRPWHIPINNL